ncbi:phosphocholine cytidylyltransferase family protein [Novosphingobium sp. 9]|uniref:phosphocholine cytidylyltransferase family protein n=1 Tax=Novosphingobium sp. 9 TaxID=2025349 RepID=UPI0021B686E6|nr:phosphocholine cytidylyltransferase family protein [Novosphingobium sp. 9]
MIEHAILLSAGQGSRLLPLTAERPKCMIDFSGKSLIAWQIEMLARGGFKRIDIVTGFMTDMLDEHLAAIEIPGVEIKTFYNPFFKVADNLGSCWIVRHRMQGDFVILNGDTLVSEEIVAKVQEGALAPDGKPWPITVTVDVKADGYDSDDMKVEREADGRLVHIGKTLTAAQSNAESIGFLAFRGEGVDLFRETVRKVMRTPEGVQHWYLKVIDWIAPTMQVGTVSIEGLGWGEVDFLNDIEVATKLTDSWV